MLVSAISATHNRIVRPVNYGFINSRGGESATSDISVNNFNSPVKKVSSSDDTVFESINEWQAFCQKQIAGSKLNIIA